MAIVTVRAVSASVPPKAMLVGGTTAAFDEVAVMVTGPASGSVTVKAIGPELPPAPPSNIVRLAGTVPKTGGWFTPFPTMRPATRAEVWPSGLVTVSVRAPSGAPTVLTVSVSDVGLFTTTLVTVTPVPLNDAARRRGTLAPGSKKPRPPVAVPVTVTATPVSPGATLVGVTDVMTAGGGASRRVNRTA